MGFDTRTPKHFGDLAGLPPSGRQAKNLWAAQGGCDVGAKGFVQSGLRQSSGRPLGLISPLRTTGSTPRSRRSGARRTGNGRSVEEWPAIHLPVVHEHSYSAYFWSLVTVNSHTCLILALSSESMSKTSTFPDTSSLSFVNSNSVLTDWTLWPANRLSDVR